MRCHIPTGTHLPSSRCQQLERKKKNAETVIPLSASSASFHPSYSCGSPPDYLPSSCELLLHRPPACTPSYEPPHGHSAAETSPRTLTQPQTHTTQDPKTNRKIPSIISKGISRGKLQASAPTRSRMNRKKEIREAEYKAGNTQRKNKDREENRRVGVASQTVTGIKF